MNIIKILSYIIGQYDENTLSHCMKTATLTLRHSYAESFSISDRKLIYTLALCHALIEQGDLNVKIFCKVFELNYPITKYVFSNLHKKKYKIKRKADVILKIIQNCDTQSINQSINSELSETIEN